MTTQAILKLLHQYGHLRVPEADLATLNLSHPLVLDAARSYQQFMAADFQPLVAKHHARLPTYDGIVGPATQELFEVQRCAVPDFALTEEALGAGRWGQCKIDLYPNNHAVTVAWDMSKCPAHVKPVFETVWLNVFSAYAAKGMALVREDGNANANIQCRFTVPQQESGNLRGSWIGLAIVGWAGIKCSEEIWALFDLNYKPANVISEWTTLVKHELGHSMGLSHSQGGVMNPSIIPRLPVPWDGDPSEPILSKWFGGEPVPTTPGGPEMWVTQCLKSDRGRELCLPLHPPRPVTAGA